MNRRLFGLGLLLFIFGVVLAYISAQSVFSSIPGYISASQSIAVQPNAAFVIPISINNFSILQAAYNSSLPVDFYLMNSTAYSALMPTAGNTLIRNAKDFDGRGVLFVINDSNRGTFPYVANLTLSQKPFYWNNQTILGNGTYYVVFQNYNNKTNMVFYTILNRSISSISESERNLSYGNILSNIFGTLFFIIGIILMFYGFFMKGRKEEAAQEEEAKKIYGEADSGRERHSRPIKRLKRRSRRTVYMKGRKKR